MNSYQEMLNELRNFRKIASQHYATFKNRFASCDLRSVNSEPAIPYHTSDHYLTILSHESPILYETIDSNNLRIKIEFSSEHVIYVW